MPPAFVTANKIPTTGKEHGHLAVIIGRHVAFDDSKYEKKGRARTQWIFHRSPGTDMEGKNSRFTFARETLRENIEIMSIRIHVEFQVKT